MQGCFDVTAECCSWAVQAHVVVFGHYTLAVAHSFYHSAQQGLYAALVNGVSFHGRYRRARISAKASTLNSFA